jgi:hypothetical protein
MAKIRKDGTKILSAYEKAQAWVKTVNISRIPDLDWLLNCTIRQLRAIAGKINNEQKGWVFCTATLGKAVSKLVKAELADVIWNFILFKRQAPKTKYFSVDECGNCKIITERPGEDASAWTVNIGYDNYKDAEVLQKFLHSNEYCEASVIRKAKHCTGFKYELKIWLLSEKVLKAIITKENNKIKLERKAEINNWYEELQQIAEQHKLSVFQPNYLSQSSRLTKNNSVIGAVGVSLEGGYWYNIRPSSAVSRNMPASTLVEAVEKLVSAYNARMDTAIA